MTIAGHQDYWVTGSRFYFQRDAIGGVVQPILDFGTIDVASPSFDPSKIELKDGDGGIQRLVDERIIESAETYEITGYNLSPTQLALMYSGTVEDLDQAVTTKDDIKHRAVSGHLIKILDDDYDSATEPRFTLGVTTIDGVFTEVSDGGDELVLGVDYEIVSLERALIRIIPSSTVITADDDIFITFTPRLIAGARLIKPNTASGVIQGRGLLVYGRDNNASQTARIARFSLTPQTPNLSITEHSSLVFSLSVLEEIGAAEPAGRVEYWLGTLPSAS
ncbi:MAG: hypothetical protein COA69_09395 [Robiginitomaculum sp.]|nr:MAG: hypothetical protein COA69_09395 [Robiginitomaculum sp.]